jgi:large subunit ribosomal protein L6
MVMTDVAKSGRRSNQSRVGKRPVEIPDGVELNVNGVHVSAKGPKGTLERNIPSEVSIEIDGKTLVVRPKEGSGRDGKRLQGLARALISNMVEGVSKGFTSSLDLFGVGYRAVMQGNELSLSLGYSHPIKYTLPEHIAMQIETVDQGGVKRPRIHVTSHDKELLGRTVAHIRSFRPPEPYKGKGIRYTGEHIREKAGKTGAKTE